MVSPQQRFGAYLIERKLQGGGMGRVYLARDVEHNGRWVALKLIDHGQDEDTRLVLEAERRGALLQTRLCGVESRVAQVYGFGDDQEHFWIAMEYVEGHDLSELLAQGPLPVGMSLSIALDVAEVLAQAHAFTGMIDGVAFQGMVHGDIKPRNIRLASPDQQVKVLDFGIAKSLSSTRPYTRNLFGSVPYSSPERLQTGDMDERSDLWSVGVVLYEMLTGAAYFESRSTPRLEQAIREYRALRPIPSQVPRPVQALLAKALDPDPQRRFRSAGQLCQALRALQGLAPQQATETDERTRRTSQPIDDEATRRATAAPPVPETRYNPAWDEATRRSEAPPRAANTYAGTARTPNAPQPVRLHQQPVSVTQAARWSYRNWRSGLAAFATLFLVWAIWNERQVSKQAGELERALRSERLTDVKDAMVKYEELAQRGVLPFLLNGPRGALRDKLIANVDRTIEEYRESDTPRVTEGDWIRARTALQQALELLPGDKAILGRLRLCEGHIARINAPERGQARRWQEARAKFEEASELISKTPDPYLGLARVYSTGLKDVDKLAETLRQAEKRGHTPGKRERAQLADAYRDRAEQTVRRANTMRGREQEDLLRQAIGDYKRAEQGYEQVVLFGNAARSLALSRETRASLEQRLEAPEEQPQ